MKLLLLSSSIDTGAGYGNITYEYCQQLEKKGIEYTLLLPKGENVPPDLSHNVQRVLPEYIFSLKNFKALEYFFFRYKTDADIIHSLFAFPYAIIGCNIARRAKKPFIIGGQGTYSVAPLLSFPDKYFLRYAYNYSDQIIVPSQFTKNHVQKFSHTVTPIQVIHNGVNFHRFFRTDIGVQRPAPIRRPARPAA